MPEERARFCVRVMDFFEMEQSQKRETEGRGKLACYSLCDGEIFESCEGKRKAVEGRIPWQNFTLCIVSSKMLNIKHAVKWNP